MGILGVIALGEEEAILCKDDFLWPEMRQRPSVQTVGLVGFWDYWDLWNCYTR